MTWCTSSTTPSTVWCSCTTPLMRKAQTADSPQRGEEHPANGVAQRMSVSPLEGLDDELADPAFVRSVLSVDLLGKHESGQINLHLFPPMPGA
jgi:hypothetical protein